MSKKIFTLLAFGAALSSCTSAFVPGPDVALVPHYKQKVTKKGETIQPTTDWWVNFSDPTLNGLVEEALAQNISVETARERVRQARYTARIVKGGYEPSISATGDMTTTGNKPVASNSPNITKFSGGLTGSWVLDYFGSKSANEREKHNVEIQKEALNAARLTVIADIATAYVNAQATGQQIDIAQKSLAVQNNTAQITKAKLDAGSASALDSAQAEAAAALQYINAIAFLLGKEPAEINGKLMKYKAIKRPKVKFNEGVPADLLRNRPDVRQAEQTLKSALANIGVEEAALLPSFSLSGTLTSSTTTTIGTTGWSFGPSVSLPIFNRGTLHASVDYAKSSAKQDYLSYRSTVLTAVKEVENALVAVKQEREHYQRLSVAVEQYTRAEQLARQLYDAGNTAFSDVLDAQSSLYSAQLQLAQSSQQLALNYITLCQALGGGWDGNEPVLAAN